MLTSEFNIILNIDILFLQIFTRELDKSTHSSSY